MKKFFVILVLAFIFFSCDNDDMNKETNPYPDGVYPFEVSNVGHTQVNTVNFTVTWTPPADKGFTGVQVELFAVYPDSRREDRVYSSVTGQYDRPGDAVNYRDFVTGKTSFSYVADSGNDQFVIIKCVDKFGNVSNGIKYEFSWSVFS